MFRDKLQLWIRQSQADCTSLIDFWYATAFWTAVCYVPSEEEEYLLHLLAP